MPRVDAMQGALPFRAPAADARAEGRVVVVGEIESLNASSTSDGAWAMGHVRRDRDGALIPFTGRQIPLLHVGCAVRLVGAWDDDPEYGMQLRVLDATVSRPRSREALIRYIVADRTLHGCGPATAEYIVDQFGPSCLDVLARDPERIFELERFKGKRASTLYESWRAWADLDAADQSARQIAVRLMEAGVTYPMAHRIQRFLRYADAAEIIALKQPYRLMDVPGIGFEKADRIARGLGLGLRDPARIEAGLRHALLDAQEDGHSALPRDELLLRASELLRLDAPTAFADALTRAVADGVLREDRGLVFAPVVLEHEWDVADAVADLASLDCGLTETQGAVTERVLSTITPFSDAQRDAVRQALSHGIFLLTGRPGSGKTTTLAALVRCCEALGWSVRVVAPTGKAASRAKEVTGLDASTIHRLVGGAPGRDRAEAVAADVVIVDETSMVDLATARWLLRNLKPGARVVVVGDAAQLPSVGHGSVLRDLLWSEALPHVALTTVYRSEAESTIIHNANALLDGEPLYLSSDDADFRFCDVSARRRGRRADVMREHEEARECLVAVLDDMVRRGIDPAAAVQVMTPMRRGPLGVTEINALLQQVLNPHGEPGPQIGNGASVRVGDRVIQTRNDYKVEGGLFNGEQGVVTSVDRRVESVTIRVGQRSLTLRDVQLYRLQLAWAITVHRAQGSEYPHAVLLCHESHRVMLNVPLLYTAITRAKQSFTLIGTRTAVQTAVSAGDGGLRHTGLAWRIGAVLGAHA